MRLLALTTSFPRDPEDFAGRFVHDLHAGLREEGCEVTTLCPAAPGAAPSERTEAGTVLRLEYAAPADLFYGDGLEANWPDRRRRLRQLRSFLAHARRRLRELAPAHDAALAHWLWPGAACAARAVGDALPLIGVGHGGDLHLLARPLLGRLLLRSLRGRLRGALCTHARGADLMSRRLGLAPDRIRVGPMGADPARFRPPSPEAVTRAPAAPSLVVGVGRLVPIKGFDLLVRAAAGLPVELLILGEGPERDALAALAARLGVALRLPGRVSPREVVAALHQARCAVVPSREGPSGRTEGFPVAAVEALLSGTPLLAAATGGLPGLLPAEALFAPGDAEALAAALRRELAGPRRARPLPEGLTRRDVARRVLDLLAP